MESSGFMCSARKEIGNRDIIWELNLGRPFRARTFKERIFWLHRNYAWQSPLGPVWSLTLSWICLLSLDTKRREENAGLFERLLSFPDPICSRNLCGRKTGHVETEQKSAFLWFFMKKKSSIREKKGKRENERHATGSKKSLVASPCLHCMIS